MGSERVFPGRLACEAVGNAVPGAATGTFAVVLVGGTDAGWLVDAVSAEETIDIVRGTLPRAREVWRSEPLVGTEDYYRRPPSPRSPVPWTTADCSRCVGQETQLTRG